MHSNDRKARFSLAYINAVAAYAGFDVVEPKVDIDSVDGMLLAHHGRRPRLEFQAKATARDLVGVEVVTEATDCLKTVRLGPSERGSYVLTVLSPVQPRLGPQQQLDLGDEPFARTVTLRLADALSAAKRAADRALADNAFDPFDAAVSQGVSANLCDAIARLAETARGVDIGLTWARTRPAGRPRQTVHFTPEVGEVLREAAAIFRRSEPMTDSRVTGFVVALDRPVDQFDGNATLRVLVGERPRRVRVRFEEAVYSQVMQAFRDKSAISLRGDLFPTGQRWEIRNPRALQVLEDQDGDEADDAPSLESTA